VGRSCTQKPLQLYICYPLRYPINEKTARRRLMNDEDKQLLKETAYTVRAMFLVLVAAFGAFLVFLFQR
jgi:uncharacterized membrane protein